MGQCLLPDPHGKCWGECKGVTGETVFGPESCTSKITSGSQHPGSCDSVWRWGLYRHGEVKRRSVGQALIPQDQRPCEE